MSSKTDVAIIGSGPYGLSLATYLRKKKVAFRIFGKPMGTWRNQMPAGMCLKSEGFASNLYHPDGLLPLKEFCNANGIKYADIGVPVQLSTFCAYGLAFQKKFVPDLDENLVTELSQDESGFRLMLENGECIQANRVVIAAGINHYKYFPPALVGLPAKYVSHTSTTNQFDHFKERDVIVVGAGSSAIDVAATLHDAGARPQLLTRRPSISFHSKAPDKRTLMTRIKAPWSGLGPSWRSRLACDLPLVFHVLPREFRFRVVRKHLGPAAGWFTKAKIVGNVPMHVGASLVSASIQEGKVHLKVSLGDNGDQELVADHVIAGTGYRIDLTLLPFMTEKLRNRITTEDSSPILSSNFETSVPGLYFVGTSAANSFGPLLRFTFGAGFTSPRLSRHLARSRKVARIVQAADAQQGAVQTPVTTLR